MNCHIQTTFVPFYFFEAIIRVQSICDAVSQLRLGGLEAEAPQGTYTN